MLVCSENIQDSEVGLLGPVFHVVGKKFSEFANDNTVITLARAIETAGFIARNASGVVIGQGVSDGEASELENQLNEMSRERKIPYITRSKNRAKKELVQKREEKNVLITHPKKVKDDTFNSFLVIDDDCAEMSDHKCGDHVQGTLLVEAAKQMLIASAVTHVLPKQFSSESSPVQFTLKSMEIFYYNFIFPVEATITLKAKDIQIKGLSASGTAEITFSQFGHECCKMRFKANAYTKTLLNSIEKRSANKAHQKLIALQKIA